MTTPFTHERLDECAAEIAKAPVPFYAVSDGKICQERSGVLFRLGERHFVLTCAHEIKDYDKHNLPAFLGPLATDSARPIRLKNCAMVRVEENGVDLAIIELENDVVEQLLPTNRFISIAEMDVQAAACPAYYLISGYPRTQTTMDDTGHGVKTVGLWYVTVLHNGELNPTTTFDPHIHILLSFGKEALGENGERSLVPHPIGMSGCGIWRLTKDEDRGTWTPEDVRLVAIQHRYDARRDYVMGSWIRFALQMLWCRCEDLRPAMQIVVPPPW